MKRTELRRQILNSSWETLNEKGGKALQIRNIAKECDCSVGTIYNVFEGIHEIILRLNIRSLRCLTEKILAALKKTTEVKEGVRVMGNAYLDFAKTYPHQWTTLFERESVQSPPKWYVKEIDENLRKIEAVLIQKFGLQNEDAIKLVGFFWAAIHGITSILLHKKTRIVERIIKEEDIDRYIDHCLMGMIP